MLHLTVRLYKSGYFIKQVDNIKSWESDEYSINARRTEIAKLLKDWDKVIWRVDDDNGKILATGKN